MPFVTILNETDSDLHIAMLAGVPSHFDNNVPPGGQFRAGVTSVRRPEPVASNHSLRGFTLAHRRAHQTPWGYEARIPRPGNEFSSGES